MSSQVVRRALGLQRKVPMARLTHPLQTSALSTITKSCNVEDVHVAETENEAANEFLGVRFNATKIKKYSAELEVDGRTFVGGDFWTPKDAAKAYDRLVALHGDDTMPRNFA